MYIVHVDVRVKAEQVEGFRRASRCNAENSVQEPGVARFDVIQSMEDPTRFVLVEVYRDEAAAGAHKDTAHYKEWRDAVADMMAEPRQGRKYDAVCPDVSGWK